jgi:predicted phosphoribosyltransferase
VAAEIARALGAPLDVLVARKISAPGRPEVAIGALVGDDPPLLNRRAVAAAGLTGEELATRIDRERAEARRRDRRYRAGRPAPHVAGRVVILVDDGLATGLTARAALRHLRRRKPARLILAVPVGSQGAVAAARPEADDVVCPCQPSPFRAVSRWYEDFDEVSDVDVVDILTPRHTRRRQEREAR